MSVHLYINEQVNNAKQHLFQKFKYHDFHNHEDINKYLEESIKAILSVKTWIKHFEGNEIFPKGVAEYIKEIVSNLNQVTILGILGFKSPSYAMLRRSLENILVFLYYKDHPVEFFKKNISEGSLHRLKDLKEYIKSYPFELIYSHYEESKDKKDKIEVSKKFVRKTILVWEQEYSELSKYIHASNPKYLDLINYIDEIHPSSTDLETLSDRIKKLNSIVNSLLIIFFPIQYQRLFNDTEKSLIRISIENSTEKERFLENLEA